MLIAFRKIASGENCLTGTPNHVSSLVFPYINSTFYFICFSLFLLQARELGLLAAIPVCVLVVCETLLTAHLHAPLLLPEANILNTKQCIIKTHTMIPAIHG